VISRIKLFVILNKTAVNQHYWYGRGTNDMICD